MSDWSDPIREQCKQLWRDGLSASQITNLLNRQHKTTFSRNAIIGVIHRGGLSGRATPTKPQRIVYKRPSAPRSISPPKPRHQAKAFGETKVPPTAPAPTATVLSFTAEEPGLVSDLLHLGAHMCKWPIGDVGAANFSFCGRRTEDGQSYCDWVPGPGQQTHAQRAHQPQTAERKKRDRDLQRLVRRYA